MAISSFSTVILEKMAIDHPLIGEAYEPPSNNYTIIADGGLRLNNESVENNENISTDNVDQFIEHLDAEYSSRHGFGSPTSSSTSNSRRGSFYDEPLSPLGQVTKSLKRFFNESPVRTFMMLSCLTLFLSMVALSHSGRVPPTPSGESSRFYEISGLNCEELPSDLTYGDEIKTYNGHSYQIAGGGTTHPQTWFQALSIASMRCLKKKNGYLAMIDNAAENTYISNLLSETMGYSIGSWAWIGAVNLRSGGELEWLAGNPSSDGQVIYEKETMRTTNFFSNFCEGEPGGPWRHENCVKTQFNVSNTHCWSDVSCYTTAPFFVIEYDAV